MAELTGRDIQKGVLEELKGIRQSELPQPVSDWDLIWVLSGPEITLEENNDKGRNETRERLETGFGIARATTAQRLGKPVSEVTTEDVRENGPTVYFNGYNEHNNLLRKSTEAGLME